MKEKRSRRIKWGKGFLFSFFYYHWMGQKMHYWRGSGTCSGEDIARGEERGVNGCTRV